ncbi:hypothetical protein BXQ17_08100 [Polaribacter sp. BM10]|uniref:restriction endonuclease subunit S n=1 Tax=Polaribacter sp. BM10 TaxID=1529069 RepID=UPI0009BC777A|nr:restriction endonuclease subunit S [Polaribacter sp. BM10]AQS94028.1 hypothetical protein BXQ17_08100 [Polaribacter sp. BM10]
MNNEKQKPALSGVERIVPELRFPEFENNNIWEIKSLNSISENLNNRRVPITSNVREKGNIPYYGATGVIDYVKDYIFNENLLLISEDGANLIDRNYPIAYSISGKTWVNNHAHVLKPINEHIQIIVEKYINSVSIEDYLTGQAQPKLNKANLNKIPIPLPKNPKEQQKIANCLSSLDTLITAETEKLDHLKDHKKGLLQQLFPANGETKPQFRFPEFKNDGDWEIKEVGEIFEVTRGYVLSMSLVFEKQTEENNYPVYSSQTKNNGLAGYYKDFLYENAITWTTDGANAGDVNYRDGKFYCTNVCGVLINNNGMANKCIAALINSVSKSHVSYIGNPKLMNGVMSKIEIPIPSLNEQIKISEVITSADDLIEAQVLKIKNLKKHKKGLMQQLFPNVNEL